MTSEKILQELTHKSAQSAHSIRRLGRTARRIGENKRHQFLKDAVHYDQNTGIFTSTYKEGIHVKGIHDKQGRLFIVVNSRKYAAERLAWFLVTSEWPKRKIQHKNDNIADNRFDNLEEVRSIERKIPKVTLSEGVHYSASDNKWVAIVYRNRQHYNLGRYTSERAAIKAVARFTKNLNEDALKNESAYNVLAQLKNKKQLGTCMSLTAYQRLFIENILTGWGAWAYQEIKESNENVIAKMMLSSSDISDTALVDIIDGLYSQGYKGKELFEKASDIIASLRHRHAEQLADDEALKVDKLLIETFGRNSPIIKIAVSYYVYGHAMSDIANYLEKITDYRLTNYQARNRVNWCLDYLKTRFYRAYQFWGEKS